MNKMENDLSIALYQVLDAIERGEITLQDCLKQFSGDQDELEELLLAITALRNVPLPSPDPDFRVAARDRILGKLVR